MKIKIFIYVLKDEDGDIQSYDAVTESYKYITIGAVDKKGDYHQFDSCEAYYAYDWAEKYGFTVECIEKEIEV